VILERVRDDDVLSVTGGGVRTGGFGSRGLLLLLGLRMIDTGLVLWGR